MLDLKDLEVYQLSKELARKAWEIYSGMDFETKKIIGSQFIKSTDSIGANIAEGEGRFHYLDRNKFNYNSRGSLFESIHWLDVMEERKIISKKEAGDYRTIAEELKIKLNYFIASIKKTNNNQ
ncbi:MAG TPA: four helix bundle protein [Candidatus Paceibacterota bacterium]|nr:four helix bundle protein [Candidatus Paceibacterota bacterium]